MTGSEVCNQLRLFIYDNYGSQAEAGRIWGVSTTFVNMVLSGRKSPTQVMLDALGIERVTVYRQREVAA